MLQFCAGSWVLFASEPGSESNLKGSADDEAKQDFYLKSLSEEVNLLL